MKAVILTLALALSASVATAQTACRQALLLAIDVSGSVDAREYAQQVQGIAHALTDPQVMNLILSMPAAPISLAVMEWSGSSHQRMILDWTSLTDRRTVTGVAARIATTPRVRAPKTTAIGQAMLTAAAALDQTDCWARTLDVSGDGTNNNGPRPEAARSMPDMSGVTVNALVIGTDDSARVYGLEADISELVTYFQTRVITGPRAFVEAALGYDDYARAMTRKLIRELSGLMLAEHAP